MHWYFLLYCRPTVNPVQSIVGQVKILAHLLWVRCSPVYFDFLKFCFVGLHIHIQIVISCTLLFLLWGSQCTKEHDLWIKMHSTGWTWITTKLYATTFTFTKWVNILHYISIFHIIYKHFTLHINILNQNALNRMDMNNNTNIWKHFVEDDDTAPEGLKAKCFTPAAVIFMFPFTGKNITLLFTCFDKWGTHMSRQYASICFHNFQFLAKTISPLKRGKH